MNNRYALQGLLCIVIHAALVEGVVPADQLSGRENLDVRAKQENVENAVHEKLPEVGNDGMGHHVNKPNNAGLPNLPGEPMKDNNLDNIYPGAHVDKNIADPKIPKKKKKKTIQENGPVRDGDIASFKNPVPPKSLKGNQDLHSLQKFNSDFNGGQPAVLPVANINFTHDDLKKGSGVKSNQRAPQNHRQAESKPHYNQNQVQENLHANNIQQQAELRKQERENARRTQENERQEKKSYQRTQERQIQRQAEEVRAKKTKQDLNQNINDNVPHEPNHNDEQLGAGNVKNRKESDAEALGENQNADKFHQEEQEQQRHVQLNGGEDLHQNQDVAGVRKNKPKPEVDQNLGQPIVQNDKAYKDIHAEGEQGRPDEVRREDYHKEEERKDEERDEQNKDVMKDAHLETEKRVSEGHGRNMDPSRGNVAQQQEPRTGEAIGKADVKWDGDDFALMFGDSVYMEQKIRRASVPTAGEPWPKPQYMKVRKTRVFYIPDTFKFNINEHSCDIIKQAVKRYEKIIIKYSLPDMHDNLEFAQGSEFEPEHLKYEKPPYSNASALVSMNVRIRTPCVKYPSASMDESYTLVVKKSRVYIAANEVWGALRGLETFSQLVVVGTDSRRYIKEVLVNDYARFQHRGVLIDTSRHFIFKEVIYDVLEAMAQNKMNVMHWHIVDDQSFPYASKAFPDLSKKGAFQADLVYTHEDIADVIEFARLRGIRVMPEFDTPGHTYSWGLGYPNILTQCYSGASPVKGYLGPLNPASNYTYEFLHTFFEEVLTVFKEKYIHLGGDEVPLSCWISNPEILKFSETIGAYGDTRKLMEYYETRLIKIIEELASKINTGIKTVVWQDVIDTVDELPERVIINVWRGGMPDVQRATSMGHQVIYSTCWYLDLIEYGSRWYKYYLCDPTDSSSGYIDERLVIGGEAALWAEYIDNENLMTTLWPRASAAAERLWSHKDTRDVVEAGRRIIEHRCRMLGRGLSVSQISGPDYCPSRGPRKIISAYGLMEEQDKLENVRKSIEKKSIDTSHIEVERFDMRIGTGQGRECGGWATRTSLIPQGNGWILIILTLVILAAVFFQIRNNSVGHSANRILKNKTILFSFVTLVVIYVTCYTTIWLQVLDVKRSVLKVENTPMDPNPRNSFAAK